MRSISEEARKKATWLKALKTAKGVRKEMEDEALMILVDFPGVDLNVSEYALETFSEE